MFQRVVNKCDVIPLGGQGLCNDNSDPINIKAFFKREELE